MGVGWGGWEGGGIEWGQCITHAFKHSKSGFELPVLFCLMTPAAHRLAAAAGTHRVMSWRLPTSAPWTTTAAVPDATQNGRKLSRNGLETAGTWRDCGAMGCVTCVCRGRRVVVHISHRVCWLGSSSQVVDTACACAVSPPLKQGQLSPRPVCACCGWEEAPGTTFERGSHEMQPPPAAGLRQTAARAASLWVGRPHSADARGRSLVPHQQQLDSLCQYAGTTAAPWQATSSWVVHAPPAACVRQQRILTQRQRQRKRHTWTPLLPA